MMRTLAAKIFMGMKIMVDLHEPIYHTTPVYHEAPVHHPAAFVHHGGPIHHVAPVHHAVVHHAPADGAYECSSLCWTSWTPN